MREQNRRSSERVIGFVAKGREFWSCGKKSSTVLAFMSFEDVLEIFISRAEHGFPISATTWRHLTFEGPFPGSRILKLEGHKSWSSDYITGSRNILNEA